MSADTATLAQLANQRMAIVAVAFTWNSVEGAARSLPEKLFTMYLLERIVEMSLRAAGVQIKPFSAKHELECVIAAVIEDAPAKSIEALRLELELAPLFIQKRLAIAHFDWNEARWIRDFPQGDPRPFAPWLDLLAHLRRAAASQDIGPDVRRLFGDADA